MNRDENDRVATKRSTDLQVSHPDPKLYAEFQRGYDLGLQHGIEREREKWMNQIHGIVSDAIEEALREYNG